MKLTKEECELALEEYDFRSERPLPHEYKVLRQLIKEHFELVYDFQKLCYEALRVENRCIELEKALDKACEFLEANRGETKEYWKEYLLDETN